MTITQRRNLRARGAQDFRNGWKISSYYAIALPNRAYGLRRHDECGRSCYEMGWRDARDAARERFNDDVPIEVIS